MKKLLALFLASLFLLLCGCQREPVDNSSEPEAAEQYPKDLLKTEATLGEWGETELYIKEFEQHYELQFPDRSGDMLKLEQCSCFHNGWLQIFIYNDGEQDYILTYNPSCYQGLCYYSYSLYTLTYGGQKSIVRENSVEFDINGRNPLPIEKLVSFAEELNGILADSRLLFSTFDSKVQYGDVEIEQFYEEYDWLYNSGFGAEKLYTDSDTLREKLEKYDKHTTDYYHNS